MSPHRDRVIACVDVDSFGVQVIRKLFPELIGKPCGLLSTPMSDAIFISLSYEAQRKGVSKDMSPAKAKQKCPEIEFRFQNIIFKRFDWFNHWSEKIINAIPECGDGEVIFDSVPNYSLEKISMDEFYVDITDWVMDLNLGYDHKVIDSFHVMVEKSNGSIPLRQLALKKSRWGKAALIVKKVFLDNIFIKTGIVCSAGISYNKQLSKIACSFNKPNAITILESGIGKQLIFKAWPLYKCEPFGGELGRQVCQDMVGPNNVYTNCLLSDVRQHSQRSLIERFGSNTGLSLWQVSRGIDYRPVKHCPLFSLISVEKTYDSAIHLMKNINVLKTDLDVICDSLEQKLKQPGVRWLDCEPGHITRLRIEIYTKTGRTLTLQNSGPKMIEFGNHSTYPLTQFMSEEGLPMILALKPQLISGVRVVVLSARRPERQRSRSKSRSRSRSRSRRNYI